MTARHDGAPQSGGSSPIRPLFAGALFILLAVLLWLGIAGADPLAEYEVEVETSLMETIYVTAIALEAEYEATGRWPVDLESVGMDEEGLTYDPTGDGYRLVATADEAVVEYRSGESLRPFREAFNSLLPPHMVVE